MCLSTMFMFIITIMIMITGTICVIIDISLL